MKINLKAARTNKNLSQAQVCKKINISRSTLSAYENYKITPKYKTAIKLANLYETSLEELVI